MNLKLLRSHPQRDSVSGEEVGGCRQTLLGNTPGAPRSWCLYCFMALCESVLGTELLKQI